MLHLLILFQICCQKFIFRICSSYQFVSKIVPQASYSMTILVIKLFVYYLNVILLLLKILDENTVNSFIKFLCF